MVKPSAAPAPGFQGVTPYPLLSSGPHSPLGAVWGGAAVLCASGASLVAGGPAPGTDWAGSPAGGRLSPGALG